MTEVPIAVPASGFRPLVSIIITTYTSKRLKDVLALLDSLKSQTYHRLEIVFVGENDPQLCESVIQYAKESRMKGVRVLFNHGPRGLSHARNLGAVQAKGELLAFLDDDALAFPDWAAALVDGFAERPEAIGVTGPAFPQWEDKSMCWFPEEFYWMISCPTPGWTGLGEATWVRNAWGMNMAFRREAFMSCQFSEDFVGGNQGAADGTKLGLLGDDTDFSLRVSQTTGGKILYSPTIRVRHKVYRHRLSPRFLRHRAFWEGYTKATLARSYKWKGIASHSLATERALLRQVFFHFFPRLALDSVKNPALARRRFILGITTLWHISLGYWAGRFPRMGRPIVSWYTG